MSLRSLTVKWEKQADSRTARTTRPHFTDILSMNMQELPPVLDQEEVPFEPPTRRFVRARKITQRVSRKRKKPPSDWAVGALAIGYFGGALCVLHFDEGFLLAAWLTTGPLFVTVYMTFEGRGSLLNPYTLFFTTILVACITGHFIRI